MVQAKRYGVRHGNDFMIELMHKDIPLICTGEETGMPRRSRKLRDAKDPPSYGFEEFVSRVLRVPKRAVDRLRASERRGGRAKNNSGARRGERAE